MTSSLEDKRKRSKQRREADPAGTRLHQRRYRADNPAYVEQVKARTRKRRLKDPALYLWEKARRRHDLTGVEFTITVADVIIPTHCPVLGIPIGALMGGHNGATLDRWDNEKGYTPENVKVISRRANTLKSDATVEEIEAVLRYMKG